MYKIDKTGHVQRDKTVQDMYKIYTTRQDIQKEKRLQDTTYKIDKTRLFGGDKSRLFKTTRHSIYKRNKTRRVRQRQDKTRRKETRQDVTIDLCQRSRHNEINQI